MTWEDEPLPAESAEVRPAPPNPHFFRREQDGSVRVRIRFSPEEAALIEEAAGETPLLLYIHRVLRASADYHIKKAQQDKGEGEVTNPHDHNRS